QSDIYKSWEQPLIGVNGLVFAAMNDGTHGRELWRSDGTPAGTFLLSDIAPGINSADIFFLTSVGGILLFSASDGTSSSLWRSDGTPQGTQKVQDLGPGDQNLSDIPLALTSTALFFSAYDSTLDRELWAITTGDQEQLTLSAPARVAAAPGSLVGIPI